MFSKLKIDFPISKKEVLDSINANQVIQTLPTLLSFGQPRVQWENTQDENNLKIRFRSMFIMYPFFGNANLTSTNQNESRMVGRIIIGPIFLIFLSFAYSFMTYELIKNGIRDAGTDRFISSMIITSIAFLAFILIPLFVVGRWRKNLKKEIIRQIGAGR